MTAVYVSPRRDDRDNAGGGAVAVWEQSDGYRYSAPAPTRRGKREVSTLLYWLNKLVKSMCERMKNIRDDTT